MAGIYIHIPFCRKACHYCNFHFSTTHSLLPEMIAAIKREAQERSSYISEQVNTIYFGGGTPSLCSNEQLQDLLHTIRQHYQVANDAEITLEANPDDISPEKLAYWQQIGINRLSIGIQSFVDEDLRWMNRAHTADDALQAIALAQQYGFDNISIDLIYGTPTLSDEQWAQNVQTAIAANIPHLSCYALTVESKTALDKMIQLKKAVAPEVEKQARHFELLMQWLSAANYEHYEISNFAKAGKRSKHNSSYWQGTHYLGIGPSAHSFNGHSRSWNVANNVLYINGINNNLPILETELLTPIQALNEYILTSLRTTEGLSIDKVEQQWGEQFAHQLENQAAPFVQQKVATLHNRYIQLNNAGRLLADGIAADLFF